MKLIVLLVAVICVYAQQNSDNQQYGFSGCMVCGNTTKEQESFISEWSLLYTCVKKVPEYIIAKYDVNWFYIDRKNKSMPYDTCVAPTGFDPSDPSYSAQIPYALSDPCSCLEDFADRMKTSYNCSSQFMEAMDEVCSNIGCAFCDFVEPKCGAIQKRRCDLIYQQEISLNTIPTAEDGCRALNKKVQCYLDNKCAFTEEGMQQAVKQCRKDTCTKCYHICENNAFFTFVLLAVFLMFVLF